MTNEQEKSDLFIVAMKLANKPGRPGAESVEPRKRTEGNTGEPAGLRAGKACPRGSTGYAELLVGLRRSSPEVGARCVNYARRDLCGGCPVMGIPTAMKSLTGKE